MRLRSSQTREPFLLRCALGLSLVLGCRSTPATPADPEASAASTPEITPTEATDTCRDWSTLDLTSLPPLPESPYADTFETAWRTILTKHYDPTLGCLDWPALRTQYARKLVDAKDETAAYAIMNELLAELGQSHLMIVPPTTRTEGEVRGGTRTGPAIVPVEVRYIGKEVVITRSALFGIDSKLPAGAVILAVDDREVAPMIEGLAKEWPDERALGFHVARSASAWLSCKVGEKKRVTIRPHGSTTPKTTSVPCHEPQVERITMGNIRDFPATFESRMLPGKIGYVAFNIWLLPLAPRFQAAVHELAAGGMRGLVVDLRGNPGGVGMMVVPAARVLLPGPASLGEMRMREMKQDFKVLDVDDPFDGPLVLLVDERTGSTSEIFALAMQELGRAKVYGPGPTQGAALPSLIEELPGGARLQYVIADYRSPAGNAAEGRGVVPDVVVPESQADFARGVDPVLAAAIASFDSKKEP
jgi:carboxyl-terminal processing protease